MLAMQTSGKCTNVRALRVIFAGGGTGGHLYPAIAVADEIKKTEPETEILFVGTRDKIEARVVPEKGYRFVTIWISGFRRSLRLSNVLFPLKVVVAMIQSMSIIKKFQPDVVVGTGGYVSGPMLRAAVMASVPTLIQEQNSYPGVTTRLLARKVNEVHVTFDASKKYFMGARNIFVSGNPTRSDLDNVTKDQALSYFGFDPQSPKKTLLIFGGSLGAHSINQAILCHLHEFIRRDIRIIWQTGEADELSVTTTTKKYSKDQCWVKAYIDRMDYAYAASDLVVCRAGATTIAEITRLGKPAILVPYPYAAGNHQVENAGSLAEQGAVVMIEDKRIKEDLLASVEMAMQESHLRDMSRKSKSLGRADAAKDIAKRVIMLSKEEKKRR